MNIFYKYLLASFLIFAIGCDGGEEPTTTDPEVEMEEVEMEDDLVEGVDYFLPNIDLSNWKVTLPVGNPSEVEPPAILDYGTNANLQKYMFNDSISGALVFYTEPGSSTANSSYSRTELREQMVPGSNSTNWTFPEGGRLKGTLSVPQISKDQSGKDHRTIIMQIHGRLTNEQRDLIGEDDNNAPPVLKVYWQNGRVRVKTKVLKDSTVDDVAVLYTNAWTDDEGHYFDEVVNQGTFTVEVVASEGKLTVTLNDNETVTYEGPDMLRWGIFENYFKAGNYLQTTDSGSFSEVKYFNLIVSH